MATSDRQFSGSIAEIYDRALVPLLFEQYALDLATRLVADNPRNVLEIAAGTGALTRAVATRLPADARITATDLNQPMLDRAMARGHSDTRIRWLQADALALPFGDQDFDAVVCQFGAMFFPDRAAGYREARRVLQPGRHLLFNVWGSIAHNEFTEVAAEALAGLFPDNPLSFITRVPHGYFDPDAIRNDLKAAGFTSIAIEVVDHVSRASSAHDVAVALCQGTPIRAEIEARDAAKLEEATHIAAEALARRFGEGPIEGRMRALVVKASRE